MNTKQINDILRPRCSTFIGTFPSNHVPLNNDLGWSVINLDECDKPGSHWVVLGPCEYFDSYGLLPLSRSVLEHLKKKCKDNEWWYNTVTLQKVNSKTCGYYCCFYILKRCEGHSPVNIVNFLEDCKDPDKFVYNAVNKLK